MGLFSLASVGLLVWMVSAYGGAREDNVVWWGPEPLRHVSWLVQLLGVLLIVVGLTTPTPTSVKQEGVLDRPTRPAASSASPATPSSGASRSGPRATSW
jgi:uncharacterized membrane protein